ncbi:hypothetical protein OH786_00730 [Streptomyces atratus]|uniref:hypothetical protein n=2 Tax=Streptomyces atratus TaxID=1893 RepID=UPI00116138A1|nr:hypothetical protein [Streptomyces atratus]
MTTQSDMTGHDDCGTVRSLLGYYRYRERSYFLQETADSIEEEANLRAGRGRRPLPCSPGASKELRHEQRRPQQQLEA